MIEDARETARLPLLGTLLSRLVRCGRLTVVDAAGRRRRFGPGVAGTDVVIRFHDRWSPIAIAVDPMLATGEAYMDGRLTIEQGTIRDFLLVATSGLDQLLSLRPTRWLARLVRWGTWFLPGNGRGRARRNVEHHYDLPPALYDLFLDEDRLYSCAYFPKGSESIDEAQRAKIRHIVAKLLVKPDSRVLDIGCGWGALATAIAEVGGGAVTGLTLSEEQYASALARAERRHLTNKVAFALRDYREERGTYDRIVSVGMLEHVGRRRLDEYFQRVAAMLEADGVALIHSIGSTLQASDPGSAKDRWMDKYIFPGGYIPALSEVVAATERAGLWITDIEILRLHYAETLRCWWERFQARRGEAQALLGERFCRMWDFYLASAEAGFRNGRLMVFQLQLSHSRDAVPLTRDYIGQREDILANGAYDQRADAA